MRRADGPEDVGRGGALILRCRVPRLAQRRVILFFCPMLASSANQISISARSTPLSRATSSRTPGKMFDRPLGLGVMTRPGGELPVAHGAKLSA